MRLQYLMEEKIMNGFYGNSGDCGCNEMCEKPCCEMKSNNGCCDILWLLILMSVCGGCGSSKGGCGFGGGGDSCLWIIILLCCCGGKGFGGCGCK